MDVVKSGRYAKPTASGIRITRADVWRLLYLPPVIDDDLYYDSPPFSPWEPVGMTTFEDSAIRVRWYRDCSCHPLVYQHWSWIRKDGSIINDKGFNSSFAAARSQLFNIPSLSLPDQEASIAASREVFGWVTRNCEGHPPESIYSDRWLQYGETSDVYESADGSNSHSDHGEDNDTELGLIFRDE
ncbi:hypothetical protein PHISCL_00849 [Aspergillus sclerotialis]|uniref:Uncharacterized protein n=1 Tax=Aspergillus sclerotialis TaxID=2070753 RepID=A0A3A3A538_9EURO|nr:hypothetical protein PHISCL_00849 [Aspergillus sclerotialis]